MELQIKLLTNVSVQNNPIQNSPVQIIWKNMSKSKETVAKKKRLNLWY